MRRDAISAVLVAVCVACSSGGSRPGAAPTTGRTASPAPTTPAPAIAWTRLHNPLFRVPDQAVKDPALVAFADGWVVLYSRVDRGGVWRIGIARSHDLAAWTDVTTLPHDPGTEGEASPDITRAPDGRYVVTYQSFPHDHEGGQAKLYARTTTDFRTFSPPIRLAANLHDAPGERLIDAALVWSPAGLLLGYKVGTTAAGGAQYFEIARSTTGALDGPWQLIGRPHIRVYGDTIENYQFVGIDGRWSLLATSNMFDRPELFRLTGNASVPTGWLDWSPARELRIPQETWNSGRGITGATYEHGNCAFLVARRPVDGYFYLVYSDAPDMSTFGSQGHAVLAIARSSDLERWSVPR